MPLCRGDMTAFQAILLFGGLLQWISGADIIRNGGFEDGTTGWSNQGV